jgi:hypothetical protein
MDFKQLTEGGRGGLRRPLFAVIVAVLACAFALLAASASARPAAGAGPQDEKAPKVTTAPVNATVDAGQSASFEAAAVGPPAPTVQWLLSTNEGATWANVEGATSDKLTILETSVSESGYWYRAVFKNPAGQASTKAVTLTVLQRFPALTKQPASVTVEEGHSASFEATASGFPAPTVQWELSTDAGGSWTPVSGATTDMLTIAGASTSEDGEEYRAVFENTAGKATSEAATLTVHDPPTVTEQPQGVTVQAGQSATFESSASGYPRPTVQWELSTNAGAGWSVVAGATTDQLTLSGISASENGDEYRAAFSSVAGTAYSEAATLTVAVHHYIAVAWGQNTYGQLGNGSTEPSYLPEPVSGLSYVTAVAGGTRHSLALLSNGTVMAWGADEWGELGGGGETLTMSDAPVQVPGLTGVTAIAAGADFSLALRSNGTVMAWCGGQSGELGDGSTEESELPVQVKGLTGITAIAAGGEHAMALQSNGKVEAWGAGERGQLGNDNTNNSAVPVAVQGLTGAVAIAAGLQHSLAVLAGGTVMAWGGDEYGQLGNSSVRENEEGERMTELPVAVEGVAGATAVAAGARDSLVLLSNGTVMAWGEDKASWARARSPARMKRRPRSAGSRVQRRSPRAASTASRCSARAPC